MTRQHSGTALIQNSIWIPTLLVCPAIIVRLQSLRVLQLDWDEGTRMSIASALNFGRRLYVTAWDHHTFLDILFFQFLFKLLPPHQVPIAVRIVNIIAVFVI